MTAVDERPATRELLTLKDGKVPGPGIYEIPDAEYHADPVPGGSLSFSSSKRLLPPFSPAQFDYERKHPPEPTHAFDMGHAAHKLVLGIGPQIVAVDAENWRTNAAKAKAAEAREAGAVPLLTDDYKTVIAMAEAIKAHPVAGALFRGENGIAEVSLFWKDIPSGVIRRSRLDWLPNRGPGRTIITDYKTAISAHPEKFAKAAMDYGYHQQHAWYQDGITALNLADDPAFVFVVQEKNPPYLISVIELDVVAVKIGRVLNRRAIDLYAHCTKAGRWPGYSEDVELVSLPGWYEAKWSEEI